MYIDDHLIQTIASAKKILPYIDNALHTSMTRCSREWSRRVQSPANGELVSKLRAGIPNLVIRTTMITGFPGETDEHFEELEDFVKSSSF